MIEASHAHSHDHTNSLTACEGDHNIINSSNFYCEILFDYLELFYKSVVKSKASTFQRLSQLRIRTNKGNLDQKVL